MNMDLACVGAAAIEHRKLQRHVQLAGRLNGQVAQPQVRDGASLLEVDRRPAPEFDLGDVIINAGHVAADGHLQHQRDIRRDALDRGLCPAEADFLLRGSRSVDGVGRLRRAEVANGLHHHGYARAVIPGLPEQPVGVGHAGTRGGGHDWVPRADAELLTGLFAVGSADVNEHLLELDHLGPLFGFEQVRRLRPQDARHRPFRCQHSQRLGK